MKTAPEARDSTVRPKGTDHQRGKDPPKQSPAGPGSLPASEPGDRPLANQATKGKDDDGLF